MDIDKLVELLSATGGYGLAALFLIAVLFLYRQEGKKTVALYDRLVGATQKQAELAARHQASMEKFSEMLQGQSDMLEQMYYVTVGTGLHGVELTPSQEGFALEKTRVMRKMKD